MNFRLFCGTWEQQPHPANSDPLNAGSVSTLVTHLESKGKGQQGSSLLDAAASG